MRKSFLLAIIIAIAAFGWIMSGQLSDRDRPAQAETGDARKPSKAPRLTVRVRSIEPSRLERHITLNGRTEASRSVRLSAEIAGRIVEIGATEGAAIKKGAVIAHIATEDRKARLAESEALRKQRALEYQAARRLSKKGFRSSTKLAEAKAHLDAARARVEKMKIELTHTAIRATFDGVLDSRVVEVGTYLKAGDPVADVVDLDPILVVAYVSDREIGNVRLGGPGTATLVGGQTFDGKIRYIASVADESTRTFRIELEIANADNAIRDGVTSELRLPLPPTRAHRVSPAVLTLSDDGRIGVKVVNAQDRVEFVPVRILAKQAVGAVVERASRTGHPDHGRARIRQRRTARRPGLRDIGAHIVTPIDAALSRSRTVIATLVFVLIAGVSAYLNIPKESRPDINIPIIYVSMHHDGISPEDAERLLVRPMEAELKSIEGIKEIRSNAYQDGANVLLEFEAGFDADKALSDVREQVDIAKAELPDDTDEPKVNEVNLSLFPIIVVTLGGQVPERTLLRLGRDLEEKIEGIASVLDAKVGGDREERVEIIIDPLAIESYGLDAQEILVSVGRSNQLIAAGALDTGRGRFAIKVPGLFETVEDIMEMPLKVNGDAVIKVKDVAGVRRTFQDRETYARLDGQPAISLEVSKRTGENIIETIEAVRALVEDERRDWPPGIQVSYSQDESRHIRDMLKDLQNNVISAVLLVMIVVVAVLGYRTGLLVGVAIPGSFLTGILVLAVFGLTVNIVVLFSLILAVGMLVDGAIVVTEYADRKMTEGVDRGEAYGLAAKRMSWPIIASTTTTLAAFTPLLFWPGMVGEFMKFLPITLIATLTASLAMALIFVPTLGAHFGMPGGTDVASVRAVADGSSGNLDDAGGFTGAYVQLLRWLLRRPGKVILAAILILIGAWALYAVAGKGVEFFPDIEPDNTALQVFGRGNLSVEEKDSLVAEVERRVLDIQHEHGEFRHIYTLSGAQERRDDSPVDIIGVINLEFVDWNARRKADEILADIISRSEQLAGIKIETRKQEGGPPVGKPIHVLVTSRHPDLIGPTVAKIRKQLDGMSGLKDIEDGRPVPGIEWELTVDRAQAKKFEADVTLIGNVVKLVTNGLKVTDYRPNDSDDEIDIVVRYPIDYRTIDQLDQIRLQTKMGLVPLSNFVRRAPKAKTGELRRTDGRRSMTVKADLLPGVLADNKVREIQAWLGTAGIDPRVSITFKGEDEEQRKARSSLAGPSWLRCSSWRSSWSPSSTASIRRF